MMSRVSGSYFLSNSWTWSIGDVLPRLRDPVLWFLCVVVSVICLPLSWPFAAVAAQRSRAGGPMSAATVQSRNSGGATSSRATSSRPSAMSGCFM